MVKFQTILRALKKSQKKRENGTIIKITTKAKSFKFEKFYGIAVSGGHRNVDLCLKKQSFSQVSKGKKCSNQVVLDRITYQEVRNEIYLYKIL